MSEPIYREAARIIGICNSCRYCEGYCAVFPAIERRIDFARDDIVTSRNCATTAGACLPACQYAPPHEFAVNVPRVLAQAHSSRTRCMMRRARCSAYRGVCPDGAAACGVISRSLRLESRGEALGSCRRTTVPARSTRSFAQLPGRRFRRKLLFAVLAIAIAAGVLAGHRACCLPTARGATAGRDARYGHPEVPRWRRRWMPRNNRRAHTSPPHLSSHDFLWLSTVLRIDQRGFAVPLRLQVAGAVSMDQHPGAAWHRRRHRSGDWAVGIVVAPNAPSG